MDQIVQELFAPAVGFALSVTAIAGFFLLQVVLLRWILRVNERTFYLKQICDQLMKLNAHQESQRQS